MSRKGENTMLMTRDRPVVVETDWGGYGREVGFHEEELRFKARKFRASLGTSKLHGSKSLGLPYLGAVDGYDYPNRQAHEFIAVVPRELVKGKIESDLIVEVHPAGTPAGVIAAYIRLIIPTPGASALESGLQPFDKLSHSLYPGVIEAFDSQRAAEPSAGVAISNVFLNGDRDNGTQQWQYARRVYTLVVKAMFHKSILLRRDVWYGNAELPHIRYWRILFGVPLTRVSDAGIVYPGDTDPAYALITCNEEIVRYHHEKSLMGRLNWFLNGFSQEEIIFGSNPLQSIQLESRAEPA